MANHAATLSLLGNFQFMTDLSHLLLFRGNTLLCSVESPFLIYDPLYKIDLIQLKISKYP